MNQYMVSHIVKGELVDYSNGGEERIIIMQRKKCYGKCNRCVWKSNGGCSEWKRKENVAFE